MAAKKKASKKKASTTKATSKKASSKKAPAKKSASKKAGEVSYFAGKRITVMRDDVRVQLFVGDPVPEAAGWRALPQLLRTGGVVGVGSDGLPIRQSRGHFRRLGPVSRERRREISVVGRGDVRSSLVAARAARAAGRVPKPESVPGGKGRAKREAGGLTDDAAKWHAGQMKKKKGRTRKGA